MDWGREALWPPWESVSKVKREEEGMMLDTQWVCWFVKGVVGAPVLSIEGCGQVQSRHTESRN